MMIWRQNVSKIKNYFAYLKFVKVAEIRENVIKKCWSIKI